MSSTFGLPNVDEEEETVSGGTAAPSESSSMSSCEIWSVFDIFEGVVGEKEGDEVRSTALFDLRLIVTLLDVGSGMGLFVWDREGVCG